MIRHRISEELARRVTEEVAEWGPLTERAEAHYLRYGQALSSAQNAHAAETHAEKEARLKAARSCWKPLRRIMRALQKHKCAYCEQALPAGEPGLSAFHIEHIRPTRGASRWKTDAYTSEAIPAGWRERRGRPLVRSPGPRDGYPWLAYELDNLCAACSVCNQALKRNYFPIAGEPGEADADLGTLDRVERPLLLRPVGDDDRLDPDEHLTFEGFAPRSRFTEDDPRTERVRVTVRLLGLSPSAPDEGAEERIELLTGRCNALNAAWAVIRLRELAAQRNDAAAEAEHASELAQLCQVGAAHTACVRALVESFERDPEGTARVMEAVRTARDTLLIG